MNKYLVSSAVIITYTTYSLYQRSLGVQTIPVVAPRSIGNASSDSSDNTLNNDPSLTPIPTLTSIPTRPTSPSLFPTTILQNTPKPTQKPNSPYKDGTYTGDAADAFYGNIQVRAIFSNPPYLVPRP